ncbi:hypothetical protein FRB99_000762 [Tulasnella sp. 403]|nr:hypothetical protein FRB99_000762 [Tulasnella sp. 403]
MSLNIAYTFDRKSDYLAQGYSDEECGELDKDQTIDTIADTLRSLGHRVDLVGDIKALVNRLTAQPKPDWDLVFNTCAGWNGNGREAQVPAILEAYGVNFTLSDSAVMQKAYDKSVAKMVFEHHGVPTPPYAIVQPQSTLDPTDSTPAHTAIASSRHKDQLTRYPLFVKPAAESTGKGVSRNSKVNNPTELEATVAALQKKHSDQPILIETFLAGREFTVAIAGQGVHAWVLGVDEYVHTGISQQLGDSERSLDFLSFHRKMDGMDIVGEGRHEDLNNPLIRRVSEVALAAYRAIGCRDIGRVDIRMDSSADHATPFVMEINTIPSLAKGFSAYPQAAKGNGIEYEEVISTIIEEARIRTAHKVA